MAQLVERWTQDPKTGGSDPSLARSIRKICEFFRVKNVVMTRCRCAQPPCGNVFHLEINLVQSGAQKGLFDKIFGCTYMSVSLNECEFP